MAGPLLVALGAVIPRGAYHGCGGWALQRVQIGLM